MTEQIKSKLESPYFEYINPHYLIWVLKSWYSKDIHDYNMIERQDMNGINYGKIHTKDLLKLLREGNFKFNGLKTYQTCDQDWEYQCLRKDWGFDYSKQELL